MPRSQAEVEVEIAPLGGLGVVALRARWRAVTGRPAPKRLSRDLLLRVLAYRIQADALGDLGRDSIKLLDRIARGEQPSAPDRSVRAATVLVRDWDGVRHHVMATREGYAWSGETYGSLSEVAGAITGTKWNGPRFFGLRDRGGSQDQRRAGR